MSAPHVHVLKTCDTCRKALKALDVAGIVPEVTDLRADGVEAARIARWLAAVGPDVLINRKSTTWRSLDDTDKAKAETDPAALLTVHPTLIKRPVIELGDSVLVGWTDAVQARLGL